MPIANPKILIKMKSLFFIMLRRVMRRKFLIMRVRVLLTPNSKTGKAPFRLHPLANKYANTRKRTGASKNDSPGHLMIINVHRSVRFYKKENTRAHDRHDRL